MTKPYYSLVIPVLNERATLPELYERIVTVFDGFGRPYEFVFVDDGSADGTKEYLAELRAKDKRVGYISFSRNFGQQAASIAGFAHARGEVVCTLDADLQNPPEAFPKLLKALEETDSDLVTGWRQTRDDALWRTWPSWLFNRLTSWATGVRLHDYGSNLRVYRRQVTDQIVSMGQSSVHLSALTSWLGFKVHEEPVEHFERKVGKSRYNFFKLYQATLDMITSYSVMPIQVMSFVGFLTAFIGFLFGLRVIAQRLLYGIHPAQLQTTVALIFFFFGVQMISMGFVLEYLARMIVLLKKQPYYIVRETALGPDDRV